ncbi:hypothetical protein D3C75_1002660 [compost metagenome]
MIQTYLSHSIQAFQENGRGRTGQDTDDSAQHDPFEEGAPKRQIMTPFRKFQPMCVYCSHLTSPYQNNALTNGSLKSNRLLPAK